MANSDLTKINITNDIHLRRDHTMIPHNKATQKYIQSGKTTAGIERKYTMRKMYYLTYERPVIYLDGTRFVESGVIMKSRNISSLQEILHNEFMRCRCDRHIKTLNGAERDMNWFFEGSVDEICSEEFYGENNKFDDGVYTLTSWFREGIGEGYTWAKWFQEPKEAENELSYTCTTHFNTIEHITLRIVTKDKISMVTDD